MGKIVEDESRKPHDAPLEGSDPQVAEAEKRIQLKKLQLQEMQADREIEAFKHAGEQRFYFAKGLATPKRCLACRAYRKSLVAKEATK